MALTDSTQLVTEDLDKREGEAMHGQERGCMGANHLIGGAPSSRGRLWEEAGPKALGSTGQSPGQCSFTLSQVSRCLVLRF